MKKVDILAKLEEVKSRKLIDWEFQTVTDDTEVIVQYGWNEVTGSGSISHDEWAICLDGCLIAEGDPNTEGLDFRNMESLANYLQSFFLTDEVLDKITQSVENVVSTCESEQSVTISDDMFTVAAAQILGIHETSIRDEEYVDDIQVVAEQLEHRLRVNSRIEWWEQGAQFVNRHGQMTTLDLPVILPASRYTDPEEAELAGE